MNDFDEVVLDEEEEISESERIMRLKKRKSEEQAKKAKEGLELLDAGRELISYRQCEHCEGRSWRKESSLEYSPHSGRQFSIG